MPVQVHSCLIVGIEGKLLEIEADILSGLSAFTIVGLGDQSVQESWYHRCLQNQLSVVIND